MKKIIGYIGIIICFVAILVTFVGCEPNLKKLVVNSFAEVRYNVFEGETSHFNVTFMTGMREEPYTLDGIANSLVEFGVITLENKSDNSYDTADKKYTITIDFTSYSGDFDTNPFDGTLVADIQKVVSDTATVSIEIKIANITEILSLSNGLTEATVNYDQALDIALTELKNDISPLIVDKALNAEVYVKIITDLDRTFNKYYWYVAFLDRAGNTLAVIIDPSTAELVAKKTD